MDCRLFAHKISWWQCFQLTRQPNVIKFGVLFQWNEIFGNFSLSTKHSKLCALVQYIAERQMAKNSSIITLRHPVGSFIADATIIALLNESHADSLHDLIEYIFRHQILLRWQKLQPETASIKNHDVNNLRYWVGRFTYSTGIKL